MPTLLLILLAGCSIDNQRDEAFGWLCEETGRAEVTDPSEPAEGMDFAADDLLDAAMGTFTGEFSYLDPESGEPVEASAAMELVATGEVDLVSLELVDHGGDELTLLEEEDCSSRYETGITGLFSTGLGGYTLIEDLTETLIVDSADEAVFWATIDFGDYGGPLLPISFDPAEMDETTLDLDARFRDGVWEGEWRWFASVVQEGTDGDDGVAVAVSEEIGTFTLEPVE